MVPLNEPVSMENLIISLERQKIFNARLIQDNDNVMKLNDDLVQSCQGKSAAVGQFLYLEGHEYLMLLFIEVI